MFSALLYFLSFSTTLVTTLHTTKVLDHDISIISIKDIEKIKKEVSFKSILINNIKIIILIITIGVVFIPLTLINLTYNGLTIGYLIGDSLKKGASFSQLAILTLPHGIFEIPAIIIAGAAGFKIPYEIIRYLVGKKEQILTKEDIKEYLTLALISIILIIIAAFVEAYVTPRIAEHFLSR